MGYDVELIERDFGKGINIIHKDESYEQLSCRDGLVARIFKKATKKEKRYVHYETVPDPDYHGIIFKPSIADTEQDYRLFKGLTERLMQLSGEEIRAGQSDFMDYIAHSGLEQEISKIGATIRLNLKDEEGLPSRTASFLNLKSHKGGAKTSLLTYAAGLAIVANIYPPEMVTKSLGSYGLIALAADAIIGTGVLFATEEYWCGPTFAPGFIASRIAYKKKIKDPDYILGSFMQNYISLENIKDSIGNQKRFAKLYKQLDRYFGIIQELFQVTQFQRGLSLAYDSRDKHDIVEMFSYLIDGGDMPRLPARSDDQRKKTKQDQKAQEVTEQIPADFIDPWIEIPEIEHKR